MKQNGPLNDDDCRICDTVLESAARTAELIAKCEACGHDMQDAKAQNQAHADYAKAVKAQFFPDRA